MDYSFIAINIKNSQRKIWQLIKTTENEPIAGSKGMLFCFAEITDANDEKIKNIQLLIQSIFSLYINDDSYNASRTEDNLEYILEGANKKFTDICHGMPIGCFNSLSIIIGLVHNENLVLSSRGVLSAWLLHPLEQKSGQLKHRWINILSDTAAKKEDSKLFDQIIAGELTKNQSFVISSTNLWQHFTQDKFKELILNNHLSRLKDIITKTINKSPRPIDMAMLLGKAAQNPEKISTLQEKETVKNEFITEQKTEDEIPAAKKLSVSPKLGILFYIEKIIIRFKRWFVNLSAKTKIIFVFGTVLFIVFAQSLVLINQQNESRNTLGQRFKDLSAMIQLKQDEAEATLIYNDKESAKELIEDALKIAYQLPAKAKKEKEDKELVINSLNEQLNEINDLTNVSYLEPLAILPDDINIKKIKALININDEEILIITADPKIILFNLGTKDIKNMTLNNISSPTRSISWDSKNNTLYLLSDNGLLEQIKITSENLSTGSLIPEIINVDIPDGSDLSLIAYYSNKLYVVDKKNNQILKINLLNKKVTNWLKSPLENIQSSIAMDIDGSIYIVADKEVKRLFKGEESDWHIQGVNPPIEKLKTIKAVLENNFIYLIDQMGNRLIVLDKDGKLIKQFTNRKWNELSTFVINESKNEAIIFNANEVYRLDMK